MVGENLVYKERMATVRESFGVLRDKSLSEAVRNQFDGFGSNNRKLVGGLRTRGAGAQ